MRIDRSDAAISWQDVTDLFKAVGWGERSPDEVQAAFARSTFKVFAFDDVELLGFGRTIDDGRFYANIVDVVVSPTHQRQGVGRAIVEDLQSRLNGFLVVTLTAAPEVQRFYRRLGWRHQTTAMMRPRSKEQALLNCSEEEALMARFSASAVAGTVVKPATASATIAVLHVTAFYLSQYSTNRIMTGNRLS